MNELAVSDKRQRARPVIGLWVLLAVAAVVFITANVHLIYVAIMSQPACLTHLKQGEGDASRGLFSAAESSCSPPTAIKAGHS